ncbi:acyltransferase [Rhodococcus pyridinivorans]
MMDTKNRRLLSEGMRKLRVLGSLIRARAHTSKNVKIAHGVRFYGAPIIKAHPESTIQIRENSHLVSRSTDTALGVSKPTILKTLVPGARIEIGAHAGISGAAICAAFKISIGNQVLLGSNVTIVDTDFHPIYSLNRRYAPIPTPRPEDQIEIHDNVFVGANSIILKGVTIGKNSVVGAGSVVTSDVPPNSVVAGNPARQIKFMEGSTLA